MGSDFNGTTPQVGPRYGKEACPAGGTADGNSGTGFAIKGLAHIGYLPDLVEDLKTTRTPGAETLNSSAEAFLQVWERAWNEKRQVVVPPTR